MAFRQMQGPPGYDEFQNYQATDVTDPSHQLLDYQSYVNSPYVEVFPSYEGYLATYQRARSSKDRYGDLYTRVMQGQSIEDDLARPAAPLGTGTYRSMGRASGRKPSEFEVSRDISGRPRMEIKGGHTDIMGRKTAGTLGEAQSEQRLAQAGQDISLAPAQRALARQEMQDKVASTIGDAELNRKIELARKQEELAAIGEETNVRGRAAAKDRREADKLKLAQDREKRIAEFEQKKIDLRVSEAKLNREFRSELDKLNRDFKADQRMEAHANEIELLTERAKLAKDADLEKFQRELAADIEAERRKQLEYAKRKETEALAEEYKRKIEAKVRVIEFIEKKKVGLKQGIDARTNLDAEIARLQKEKDDAEAALRGVYAPQPEAPAAPIQAAPAPAAPQPPRADGKVLVVSPDGKTMGWVLPAEIPAGWKRQ